MKRLFVLAILIAGRAALAIGGAAIVYGLDTPSEEAFHRLLTTESVRYICTQQIVSKSGVPRLARERAALLKQAGKRIVLQIWWGPGGEFPWTKYSFANVALDESVRADFFREVVDPCIEQYGVANLYGVHLMEETGMQFGTDVAGHENPNDLSLVKPPTGTSYDAPFWNGFGKLPGGVRMANVRRHEDDFTRMTGLHFADSLKWGDLGDHLFARWEATRLQSGGQVEFAKHIHEKYSGLKAFTWDILLTGGENPRTDYQLEGKYFDGVICDVYGAPNYNFEFQRAYRLLCPKAEIIQFSMGGMGKEQGYPYASADQKRALTVGAYLAGVDVVGFFEQPPDFTRPQSWEVNANIFRKMKDVPTFKKKSAVLLISDSASDIYSSTYAWTALKYFDFLPTWEAHGADLDPYQVVILHASGRVNDSTIFWDADALKKKYGLPGYLDYRAFDGFVDRGGVLILSGLLPLDDKCPLFLARDGDLRTRSTPRVTTVTVSESNRDYHFKARPIAVEADGQRVVAGDGGYLVGRGKGCVFVFPFNRFYDPKESYDSPEWRDYRELLRDVTRRLLKSRGLGSIAAEYLADPDIGNAYLQGCSDNHKWTGAVVFDLKQMNSSKWFMRGTDLLTGRAPIVFDQDHTAALVKE